MTSQFEQGHSPAIRAVLNAYRDASWAPDTKDPNKHHKWSHKAGIAAALRAAANQDPYGLNTGEYDEGWGEAMATVIAIATELEN